MFIQEVATPTDVKYFLDTARHIYKEDKQWVCPLDVQIESIFNPESNVHALNAEFCRWVLFDNLNRPIGRIAAFIDKPKAFGFEQPTGGIGFFECINNQEAANQLFEIAENWLSIRGMKAMDGPVNLGGNENFWGLLVEGFTAPGIGMTYNKPYYKNLFESYGFSPYFEQITNHLDLSKPYPERFYKIAEWHLQKPGFSYKHFTFKEKDKFITDLVEIYNTAWVYHENFVPVTDEEIKRKLDDSKSFLLEDFIWFAYHDDKPIGVVVMYPDINQLIKSFQGKMNWINKLLYYYRFKTRKITRARIIIMGVVPKFQRYGVESGFFYHMAEMIKKYPEYKEVELSWVGDFNPKMRALHDSLGATFGKKHITYRKLFDDLAGPQKAKEIAVDTKYKGS